MKRAINKNSSSGRMLRLSDLRRIISEETTKILLEAEKKEPGEDSLDSQVDSFFSDFESNARTEKKNESRSLQSFMRKLLREAEEDEDKKEDEKKSKDNTEEKEEPGKLTSDDIDVDTFANEVVRLIENYDSLLEIRNTILRRAINFLLKSYEPSVADSFKESLEDIHGLQIGKSKFEMEDEDFVAPSADRAGASPGGG